MDRARTGIAADAEASGPHGRSEIDPSLVERAAQDRARAAELANGADVRDRGHPARRDDVAPAESDQSSEELEIRPTEQAVPIDGGGLECHHAPLGESGESILGADPGGARAPALSQCETSTDVQGDRDTIWAVRGDEPTGKRGI